MQRTLAFAALALTFAAVTACSAPQKSGDAMSMSSSSSDAMAPMASGDNMAMSASSMSSSGMSSDAMAPSDGMSSGMAMSK